MTSFASSVLKLIRGNLFAQAIGFAGLPIMSRLYPPGDFGVVQTVMTLLTVLLIISSLRLEIAVLSVPEAKLNQLLRCASWLTLMTSVFAWLVAAALVEGGNAWASNHATLAMILPGIGLIAGWNQLMNYLLLRNRVFDLASNAKVMQSIGYVATGVGLGFSSPGPVSLVIADAIGRILSAGFVMKRIGFIWITLIRPPSLKELNAVMSRYRSLTTVGLGTALINTAGSAFTTLMLMWLFSANDAGQYAMVERFVGMPIGLISGASSQVFISHVGRAISENKKDEAIRTFRHIIRQHALIAILPSLMLFVGGPIFLPLVLGRDWELAGQFLQAMSLFYFFSFITGPVNMALTVVDKHEIQFLWDLGRLIIMGIMWLYIWSSGITALEALWLYVAMSIMCLLAFLVMSDSALRGLTVKSASHG